MGLVNSEAFVGTRCRLYRKKDSRITNAWVQYYRGNSFIVSVVEEFDCDRGEQYYIEAFGQNVKVCLNTSLVKYSHVSMGEDCSPRTAVTFKVEGQVQVAASDEQSRHLVEGMAVGLEIGQECCEAVVRDVSANGIGIIADHQWDVGLSVVLRIDSALGPIRASGVIRYVIPADAKFRIVIQLNDLSRLDGSRWQRLLGISA